MARDKAARILDAAEELLVGFGYRRVTVEDVARRAGVGKGTVYLYWPSKRELFAGVLTREAAGLLGEQLAALRADPAEVQLHRSLRWLFLRVMGKPLATALYTGNHEILGELMTASETGLRFVAGKAEATDRYLAVLGERGLLADDPAADPALSYRLSAVLSGFFFLAGTPDPDLESKAGALATTLRRAFEPAAEPLQETLRGAAADVADLYQRWARDLTGSLPGRILIP